MRRQMFYNMKSGIQRTLEQKDLWKEDNQMKDTGHRGAIFIYDKEELTSRFKVNFDKILIEGFV
eukprot:6141861-Heterocapsa_arctica.AAC.1